jgi:hypothetical protein
MLMFSMDAYAQRNTATNLSGFDRRNYHFGFILGYNSSNFSMQRAPDFDFTDSLLAITMRPQPGFNLNLLASYDLMPNFHIRFLPGLSFQDRIMDFIFLESDLDRKTESRRIESVYLDFPINFKLRTNRSRNFAAYMLAGGKYSLDMQSQKDVNQDLSANQIIKIIDHDYSVDIGGGFDFFLEYFKLSLEFKSSLGIPNLLIQDDTIYSRNVSSLKSRAFIFSITFEG